MVPAHKVGQGKARLKRLARDKHPSLFVESVSDNKKMFYDIDTRLHFPG
jgi:hypothetical protein